MKKTLSIILSLLMIISTISFLPFEAFALDQSGSCGKNVTYTFDSSTGLLTISGTGKIDNYVFDNELGINSVVIKEGITNIGYGAFSECSGLTSIRIPNSVTTIEDYAFISCSSLASIEIPSNVKKIYDSSFKNCSNLTSIIVDSNNRVYDSRNNCNAIIKTSNNELIAGCKNAFIPNDVTRIGDNAFFKCTGLKRIAIPDSVTSIGVYAYYGCSGLTSVEIPRSVTNIDSGAFRNCSGLESVKVDSGNTIYDSRNNCNAIIETSNNELICGCNNSVIPDSVTSIGDHAFEYCYGLTSIYIPSSVTSIGVCAFIGCIGLTSIIVDSENTTYDSRNNCNAIIETSNNELIYGCNNSVIPDSVTSIGNSAFSDCSELTSIDISNSLTSIGSTAFTGCSGLECISVDSENTVYDSRDNCNAIIKTSKNELVLGCKNTIIPNSVTSIGDYAYYGCSGLTSINIPNRVTSIGDSAFYNCSGLTSVSIPKSVKQIDTFAFYECNELKEVNYAGNEDEWNDISLGYGNNVLLNATIHYNSIPPCDIHTPSDTVIENRVDATCTTNGSYDEVVYCSICGAEVSRNIIFVEKLAHSYSSVVTDPTCTAEGFTTHTCSRCGDTYVADYTDALGHAWDDGIVTAEPTETEDGVKTYTCTRCGETKTEAIPKLEHTHQYTAAVTAPTCTAKGYTTYTCLCGDKYVSGYKNALGHAWNAGVVTKKSTPTVTGVKTFTCTRCKITKAETIPKCDKYKNPLTVKAKTATVKAASVKKKAQTLSVGKVLTVSKAQGKVTYTKSSGNKNITINKTTGKVTVKKGLKKGTYKVKVKVKASGNASYKSATKTVTFTVKVK